MRERCTPALYSVVYDNGDGEVSTRRLVASSSLEAGAEFMRQMPGIEMTDIFRGGAIHRKNVLARPGRFG